MNQKEDKNMNQMQAFIKKARTDSALMAKLDALGNGEEASDKVIAIAAEYGFAITAEDYRVAQGQAHLQKSGELSEEELEAAAGGKATQNRWNPDVCGNYTKVEYDCVGFLAMCWCDHYRKIGLNDSQSPYGKEYHYSCAMGRFYYAGDYGANPITG